MEQGTGILLAPPNLSTCVGLAALAHDRCLRAGLDRPLLPSCWAVVTIRDVTSCSYYCPRASPERRFNAFDPARYNWRSDCTPDDSRICVALTRIVEVSSERCIHFSLISEAEVLVTIPLPLHLCNQKTAASSRPLLPSVMVWIQPSKHPQQCVMA